MAKASGVGVDLDIRAVPLLPGARELASDGHVPGGTRRNLAWVRDRADVGTADETTLALLADAQTSGGLVFGVGPDQAPQVIRRLRETGHDAAVIGSAWRGSGEIRLR